MTDDDDEDERLDDLLAERDKLAAEVERLRADGEMLRTVLAFYADPETYFAIAFMPDPPCGEFIDDFEPWEHGSDKPGKRARAALDGAPASQPVDVASIEELAQMILRADEASRNLTILEVAHRKATSNG